LDEDMRIALRQAVTADAQAVADVHGRSWQVAYRGLLPDEYLEGLRAEDRAHRYSFGTLEADQPVTVAALDQGNVCGFATTGPSQDEKGCGELYALYVHPNCWGLGVGRQLVTEARERMVRLGFAQAVLWVLKGNERAERFYQVDGWMADGRHRRTELWGITVDEFRYGREL
jgi:ribosomal protein S18 acetylase RimI-like enzyme